MSAGLPKGIAKTPNGFRASIRIHTELHQRRFPHGTDVDEMRRWLLRTELTYRAKGIRRSGRFSDDARAYLDTVKAMPTIDQRRQHIQEWMDAFGDRRRADITSADITAQLHQWRTETRTVTKRGGKTIQLVLSAAAVNKRRTALMHLYTTLDGKGERNPVKDTRRFLEPSPAPRAIPWRDIAAIFRKMPVSHSKAHLMTLAYTGVPPGQIGTLTAADFDGTTVTVPGRRKGQGTSGERLPLIPEGIKALKLMTKLGAFRPISRTVLRRVWVRACKAAEKGLGTRPYDLRHSFGTEVLRRTGNIRATQLLMGHSSPTLTHRYTVAAEDPLVRAAVEMFGRPRRGVMR